MEYRFVAGCCNTFRAARIVYDSSLSKQALPLRTLVLVSRHPQCAGYFRIILRSFRFRMDVFIK